MTIHFKWKENFSVGDEVIDAQHKKLLAQINKILDAVVFGVEANDVQAKMIPFLDQYIKEHFSYEEEYMKKIGYPHLDEHVKMHGDFIQMYYKFKSEFNDGTNKDKLISDIESYVGEWWINHIGKEDKKYHLYLDEQNKK